MRPRSHALLVAAAALGLALGPAGAAPDPRGPGQVVRVEHRDPEAVPAIGPVAAPVTIELFFVPNTNAEARLPAYRMIQRLRENHPARIRVIFRLVKRSEVRLPAAALEAHAQGKFFELMEELHRNKGGGVLAMPELRELCRKIGMDVARVDAAIKSKPYIDLLDANDRRLDRILRGQTSVPAVLFNARPVGATPASMSDADYERHYLVAYERAMELLDRGVDPRALMDAFDAQALRGEQPFVGASGPTDDDEGADPGEHKLATPPLPLAGLPSFGGPGARAALPLVILCRPNDGQCGNLVDPLQKLQKSYADDLRLVWAPWFDVSRDDAADLTLLGDAALCAEQLGASPQDQVASPGWQWISLQLRSGGSRGRRSPPEKLIDEISARAKIASQDMSACRARMAGTTIDWIERARRSGVTRAPAIVIGGRIYEGVNDIGIIRQLVEAELAPGVLGELVPGAPRRRP